jgi:hypothetical protein
MLSILDKNSLLTSVKLQASEFGIAEAVVVVV